MQTDHASAFFVDCVKIFLMCSLIIIQNLVVVCDTVCMHVGHHFLCWGPAALGQGRACPLETRYCPVCIIAPNFVAISGYRSLVRRVICPKCTCADSEI